MTGPTPATDLPASVPGQSLRQAPGSAFLPARRGNTETTNNMLVSESGPVGAVHAGAVPETSGTYQLHQTERAGKTYRIDARQLAKAQAYWARKSAQRRQPGNCGRCGKPNPQSTHKHCPACREYQRKTKLEKALKPLVVSETQLQKLERRIAAMEHNFSMMRLNERAIYKRAYEAGRKHQADSRYFDAYPTMTKQELATINHAYAHDE
jgi:hypothetical protein